MRDFYEQVVWDLERYWMPIVLIIMTVLVIQNVIRSL